MKHTHLLAARRPMIRDLIEALSPTTAASSDCCTRSAWASLCEEDDKDGPSCKGLVVVLPGAAPPCARRTWDCAAGICFWIRLFFFGWREFKKSSAETDWSSTTSLKVTTEASRWRFGDLFVFISFGTTLDAISFFGFPFFWTPAFLVFLLSFTIEKEKYTRKWEKRLQMLFH